jgi:branched-chain amino acid transport system substrate-binding protein
MQRRVWMLCAILLVAGAADAQDKPPIVLGLHADMSSGSSVAGESIRRGAMLAISEINAQGGLLDGRKLQLMVRDHHGAPARAEAQLPEFAEAPNLVAILGGLHSSSIIQSLPFMHQHQLILMAPWSASTDVVDNGLTPNYAFRVSARDSLVAEFLVAQALKHGRSRLGLLLERTGWGRSSEKAMKEALARRKQRPAGIEWFNWAEQDMEVQISALEKAGAQAILLVANAPEGSNIVKTMARRPPARRLPIYSHWGIAGGSFVQMAGPSLSEVDLHVFQTFSFLNARSARSQAVMKAYHQMFGTTRPEDIMAPTGTAHAYDAVWLLALAIKKAGTTDRPKVRDALEQLEPYKGLIRTYQPAFTPSRHEALDLSDYKLARFSPEGILKPLQPEARP